MYVINEINIEKIVLGAKSQIFTNKLTNLVNVMGMMWTFMFA